MSGFQRFSSYVRVCSKPDFHEETTHNNAPLLWGWPESKEKEGRKEGSERGREGKVRKGKKEELPTVISISLFITVLYHAA